MSSYFTDRYFTDRELYGGGNFIMMVGTPGSGKSTMAKNISNSAPWPDCWKIISSDLIREEFTGSRQNPTKDKDVFKEVYARLLSELEDNKNVIYDATNCYTKYRVKVLNVIKKYAKRKVCLVSAASLSKCLRHNENRVYVVPEHVVERMYVELVQHQPTLREGFDVIAYF